MTYNAALAWLFEQFPSYQKIGAKAYKPGLHTITQLLEQFNNPHNDLQFVHVAGTNGKGSTCCMIASVLTQANHKVGLFTSPHINDFRERIRVNGKKIKKKFVIACVHEVQQLIANKQLAVAPSFFEITFLMSLLYFKKKNCTICVIETGLGGRLDATNCIVPIVSVITNISIDHTIFLGNSREEIAHEKAGIIKDNIPVVIGEKKKRTKEIFKAYASERQAPIVFTSKKTHLPNGFYLTGAYQQKNGRTAMNVISILQEHLPISERAIQSGMQEHRIRKNTGFFARSQLVSKNPFVWIDVAHNAAGIKATLKQLNTIKDLRIVYGTSSDKDLQDIFRLFPKHAHYFFTEFSNQRSASIDDLKPFAIQYGLHATFHHSVAMAIKNAKADCPQNGTIILLGSFFLIADFLSLQQH